MISSRCIAQTNSTHEKSGPRIREAGSTPASYVWDPVRLIATGCDVRSPRRSTPNTSAGVAPSRTTSRGTRRGAGASHRREVQVRAAPRHFRGGVLPTSAAILGHLGIESVVRVIGAKVHELLSRCHVIGEQAGYMWPTCLPARLGSKPSLSIKPPGSYAPTSNSTMPLRTAGFGGVWSSMADDVAWSMLLGGVPKERMAAE